MASCSLALEVGRHYSSFIAPKGIHVGTYRSLFAKTSQLKNDYAIQRSKTDVDERKKGAATCRATIDSDPSLRFSSQNEWSPENRVEGVGEEIAEENVIVKEKTLRLVETAMLAATAGLAYFVSNLLRLEAYLGCFFPLPVVVSCMRWGPRAGRKTMVSTAMLLMVLSGPLKAVSYLLMHGLVGWAMGSLWSWRVNWGLSIAICAVVRSIGALGFVMLSSFMLNENLLQLITINAHATFSYILAAVGVNMVPTMNMIYFVFAFLLLLNCGSFVFLLHVLYAIFLRRLGIKTSIAFPRWVERAI